MTSPESNTTSSNNRTESESTSKSSPGTDDSASDYKAKKTGGSSETDSSENDVHIVIWGQLTTSENCNVDIYCVVNPEDRIYPILKVGIDEDGSRIESAENIDHLEFIKEFKSFYPSQQDYKYGDQYQSIRQRLIETLASTEQLQTIDETVSDDDPNHVEEEFSEFLGGIVTRASEDDWLKAVKATKSEFIQSEGELSEDWESANLEDLGVVDIDGDIYNLNDLPRITVLTSVISGVSPEDISEGEGIRIRIKGKPVEELPDHLQDERRDELSVPFDAEVLYIKEAPALPPDFDGTPSDYHGIAAKFFNDIVGYGYIHQDENIQMIAKNTGSSDDSSRYFNVRLTILLVILFSLIIVFLI